MPLRLRTLDSMGRISNAAMLKDAGFTEGMTVYRKSDATTATIETRDDGSRIDHLEGRLETLP